MLAQLGRVHQSAQQSSWFPCISTSRFSALQARHLSIVLGSFLHGVFYLVMGTRGGFPSLFAAYTIAAFARSLMTGQFISPGDIHERALMVSPLPQVLCKFLWPPASRFGTEPFCQKSLLFHLPTTRRLRVCLLECVSPPQVLWLCSPHLQVLGQPFLLLYVRPFLPKGYPTTSFIGVPWLAPPSTSLCCRYRFVPPLQSLRERGGMQNASTVALSAPRAQNTKMI